MKIYDRPSGFNRGQCTRQFILTKDPDLIPEGWAQHARDEWHLGVHSLPVLDVEDSLGRKVGWCVGYPLHHKDPCPARITIELADGDALHASVDRLYEDVGGRFILVLLADGFGKIFLDPYGSLAAVFSTDQPTVASTPTLLGDSYDWDRELIEVLQMPTSGLWFPSGLTPKRGVRRLLPNHCLDLDDWRVTRHWPTSASDLSVQEDPEHGVVSIVSSLKRSIQIVGMSHPIQLSLTAGRDSRMLLACVREFLEAATFFTFVEKTETVDVQVASRLSERFKLDHALIPVQDASEEERIRWLYLTGHAVGGRIWEIHKTLENLDEERVLLPGMGGEIGRAYYWRGGDRAERMPSAAELLSRASFPVHRRTLRETEDWLTELSGFNRFNILDLFYLEQRLGCWAAPQHYGNLTSRYELSPFSHRRVLESMMRLPYGYRRRQRLADDVCRAQWPELLDVPFNRLELSRVQLFKRLIRRLARSAGEIIGGPTSD